MKIYRILNKFEYKSFLEKHSITDYNQKEYYAAGMLFHENLDRFGKFFFFELEDVYNFAHHFSNATPDDMILELDIDRETALRYLMFSDYKYFDPTKKGKKFTKEEIEKMPQFKFNALSYDHPVLELFLDHRIVDEKIQKGEYRIIPGESILKYEGQPDAYYEVERNPKAVVLAQQLKRIRQIRQKIVEVEFNLRDVERLVKIITGEAKARRTEEQELERLKLLNEMLGEAIEEAKAYFKDFAREHEKYMMLIPLEERQPE